MLFSTWLQEWKEQRSQKVNESGYKEGERMGQSFIIDFIPNQTWIELWNEEDEELAIKLIVDYLVNVSMTYPQMPRKIGDIN